MNLRRTTRSWLLWLAFLLPIAQAMAGVHALSHAGVERQQDGLGHLVHCDLCLTAADLGAGAPAAEPAALRQAAVGQPRPLPADTFALPAAGPRLPPARGPPASA